MTRVTIDPAIRRGIQAEFPRRDVEAIHARFARWSESREIHAPERAFRTWVENAERDDSNRLDTGGKPATEIPQAPLGERSDPGYAAFRMGLVQHVLDEKLSPARVADILADAFDKFDHLPGLGALLDAEIASLRAMGETCAPGATEPVQAAEFAW